MSKSEDPEFFRDNTVYREWGYRLASLGLYEAAVASFQKAIKRTEGEDLRTLLGLCKALVVDTKYQTAAEISERCADLDPDHYRVKHARVETLFQIGEFGFSLIHAHQGLRKRRTPFEHDVFQAEEAIEDCIGRNTSPKALLLLHPWILKLEEHRRVLIQKLQEEEDEFEGINEDRSRFKVNDPDVQRETQLEKLQRVIAKIYLGYLTLDKDFVKQITEHPETVNSPNKRTTRALRELATDMYDRSVYRQEILRMKRPIYVMLLKRRDIPEGHRAIMKLEKQLRRCNIIIEADFLLRRLHAVRMRKDYRTFFGMVDRVKDKFDSYPSSLFPSKQKCLNAVYNMTGWTYIDTRNVMSLDSEGTKWRHVRHHLGIRVGELPRDIDIAWVHVVNRKRALRTFRRRFAMASQPLELSWLFHEFCKYLIGIKRFDLARFYAKKARDTAQAAGNPQWTLNSYHLTLRVEISQHNRNEAKEAAVLALTESKRLGIDYLVDFYKRTIEIVDGMDVEKMMDIDSIAARQQLISELMPDEMKTKVDFLWRSMEVVPAKRRLSVMPGCKPIDRKFKLPCRRRTILPAPPKDPEKEVRAALLRQYAPSTKRPGFVDFRQYD